MAKRKLEPGPLDPISHTALLDALVEAERELIAATRTLDEAEAFHELQRARCDAQRRYAERLGAIEPEDERI